MFKNCWRTISNIFAAVTIAILLNGIVAGPSYSQKWLEMFPPLTDGDIEIIKQKVREELKGQPIATVKTWNNPESGNSGVVALKREFVVDDKECLNVLHLMKMADESYARQYEVTTCLFPDGTWKMAP